jgi:branched-chain amino acid transport system substrate-binding protein
VARNRLIGIGLSALVAAVTLAACGSSGSSSASNSSSAPASTSGSSASAPASSSAASGAPIALGAVCDCSGQDAAPRPASTAFHAFVDSMNASGGLDGHPLTLKIADSGSNPGTAITAAQSLISDHVVAVMDGSAFDSSFVSLFQKANIPLIGGLTSNASMGSNPDVYPIGLTDDALTYSAVATVKSLGATKVGTLYCAEAPICQSFVGLVKAAATKLGLTSVYSSSIPVAAPSDTAECVAAQQAGVNGMVMFLTTPPEIQLGTDCARQGFNSTFEFNAEGASKPILTDKSFKHLSMVIPEHPYFVSSPGVTAMVTALNKYFPGYYTGAAWDQEGTEGWDGGLLLQAALKAGGTTSSSAVTSASITSGLESLKGETLGGMTVPLTFPAGKPHPIDCWYSGKVSNGVTTLLNGGKATCEPAA